MLKGNLNNRQYQEIPEHKLLQNVWETFRGNSVPKDDNARTNQTKTVGNFTKKIKIKYLDWLTYNNNLFESMDWSHLAFDFELP